MSEPFQPHLKDRLMRAFERAGDQEIMRRITDPEQLRSAREVKEQAGRLRNQATRDHTEKYDVRVKHMMTRVRDEWTRPNLVLKPNFARLDRLDGTDLRIEAERRVRRRHESMLVRINEGERRQLRRLVGLPDRTPPERTHRVDRDQPKSGQLQDRNPAEQTMLRRAFNRSR